MKAIGIVLMVVALAAGGFLYWRIASGKAEIDYIGAESRSSVPTLQFRSPGEQFTLQDLRGQAVLIDVWASWCAPCIASIPDLVRLQQRFGSELTVLGLNVDEGGWQAIAPFLEKHPEINYRVARPDPEPSLLLPTIVDLDPLGKVSALPTAFLVDREGRLVGKYVGRGYHDQIEKEIERLLAEQ